MRSSESVWAEVVGSQEVHPAMLLADSQTWLWHQRAELDEEERKAETISAVETISAETISAMETISAEPFPRAAAAAPPLVQRRPSIRHRDCDGGCSNPSGYHEHASDCGHPA